MTQSKHMTEAQLRMFERICDDIKRGQPTTFKELRCYLGSTCLPKIYQAGWLKIVRKDLHDHYEPTEEGQNEATKARQHLARQVQRRRNKLMGLGL